MRQRTLPPRTVPCLSMRPSRPTADVLAVRSDNVWNSEYGYLPGAAPLADSQTSNCP